jgi:V/A-type H+-transporting ATPase subunit C
MRGPSRLSYAYAVGRIRALERSLVSSSVFREASGERDFPSSMKAIFDAGNYEEEIINIGNSYELDEFLAKEEEKIFRLMKELLFEEDIFTIITKESQLHRVLALAEELDYAFISDYLRYRIDLGNLKILLRAKYSGLPSEKYNDMVLKGGFLDEKIFLQSYDQTFSEIGEKLRPSPYVDLWNRAIEDLEENEMFVLLERGIEDFLMSYLQRAKYIVFGPEPVFSYALAKKRELSLVRLVGMGKFLMIPPEYIKKRIGKTYV